MHFSFIGWPGWQFVEMSVSLQKKNSLRQSCLYSRCLQKQCDNILTTFMKLIILTKSLIGYLNTVKTLRVRAWVWFFIWAAAEDGPEVHGGGGGGEDGDGSLVDSGRMSSHHLSLLSSLYTEITTDNTRHVKCFWRIKYDLTWCHYCH